MPRTRTPKPQPAPPLLTWAGKRAPEEVAPAQPTLRATFEPSARRALDDLSGWNRLYQGDNLPLLHALLHDGQRGRFRLIYADPPYGSGTLWTRKVRPRGPQRDLTRRVLARLPEYSDALDDAAYLQFLYDRLAVLRELLAEDGTLWLHCDYRHTHHLRALLDELFGPENWLNTITWRSQTARGAKSSAVYFPHSAHSLHIVAKNARESITWNVPKRRHILTEAEAAAEFLRDERGFFRTSDPGSYTFDSLKRLHGEGRLYAPYGGRVVVDEDHRRIGTTHGGNIGVKYYLTDLGKGKHLVERTVDNIWDDIPGLGTTPGEDTGYPTQKTAALLDRIIAVSTNPGDWVLDPFAGSGTTLVAAQRLSRRWVGLDSSPRAIQTTIHRLYAAAAEEGAPPEPAFALLATDAEPAPAPATIDLLITRNAVDPARIRLDIAGYRSPELDALLEAAGLEPDAIDWRALVDAISIDPAWDGQVLHAAVGDAPVRRNRVVSGSYELALPPESSRIALRLTDITGAQVTKIIESRVSGVE